MHWVAVVDDKDKDLQHHAKIVNETIGFELAGVFKSGIDIIRYCKTKKKLPDIILMDIEMPNFDGLQTIDFLNSYFPQIKIIAVSSHGEDEMIADILMCGAYGYVQKIKKDFNNRIASFDSTLKEALYAVAGNKKYLDGRFIECYNLPTPEELIIMRQNEKNLQRKKFNISKIEQELLLLSGAGLNYKQLGELCNKSPRTVEVQIKTIATKLDAGKGQLGLFSFSLRNNLIKLAKLFNSK
ncbi:MAG: response regulator transcription factor [Bacteroidetes bacterium]|nr:response regulator transcription factor [Bacteroidota bacterium]MBS1592498.1 response regulator transcription factor [Bacteroidota bacterium]